MPTRSNSPHASVLQPRETRWAKLVGKLRRRPQRKHHDLESATSMTDPSSSLPSQTVSSSAPSASNQTASTMATSVSAAPILSGHNDESLGYQIYAGLCVLDEQNGFDAALDERWEVVQLRLWANMRHVVQVSASLQMASDAPQAEPVRTMLIVCNDEAALRIAEPLCRRLEWLQSFAFENGFRIVYAVAPTGVQTAAQLTSSDAGDRALSSVMLRISGSADTLCGVQLEVHPPNGQSGKRSTVGGIVVHANALYAWTTQHTFHFEQADSPMLPDGISKNSLIPKTLGQIKSADSTPIPAWRRIVDRKSTAHTGGKSSMEQIHLKILDAKFSSSELESNPSYDWCLLKLTDLPPQILRQVLMPNKVGFRSIQGVSPLDRCARGKVAIMTVGTGTIYGDLSSTTELLNCGSSVYLARRITLDRVLERGCSGAWVTQDGYVIGHLVAAHETLPWAYLVSMAEALADVEHQLGSSVRIASLEDIAHFSSITMNENAYPTARGPINAGSGLAPSCESHTGTGLVRRPDLLDDLRKLTLSPYKHDSSHLPGHAGGGRIWVCPLCGEGKTNTILDHSSDMRTHLAMFHSYMQEHIQYVFDESESEQLYKHFDPCTRKEARETGIEMISASSVDSLITKEENTAIPLPSPSVPNIARSPLQDDNDMKGRAAADTSTASTLREDLNSARAALDNSRSNSPSWQGSSPTPSCRSTHRFDYARPPSRSTTAPMNYKSVHSFPVFMQDLMEDEILRKYPGHHQIDKYCFAASSDIPTVETVDRDVDVDVEELKQWLRPTKFDAQDIERWQRNPTLRILMIKTQNQFSRAPDKLAPSHRTIPGSTEVTFLPDHEKDIKTVKEIFQHTRLSSTAISAYLKSQITFSNENGYEVDEDDVRSSVTNYHCSGISWSLAWNHHHKTGNTTAVFFYREGDGCKRRSELEWEIRRLKQHLTHPLLLAYIKTQISLCWTFKLLEEMNGQTFEIEKDVGLASWDWVLDLEIDAYKDPNISDPENEENTTRRQKRAAERYNVLSGKLINIRFRLRSFREQIMWIRRVNKDYVKEVVNELKHKECVELDNMLDRMDDFTKVYTHDADTLAERLNQQMSSLAQLITQRDSRINLAIADMNREIAWQGKSSSNAMMAIAIASFIFLPGTFIASVFDTPIFDWRGADHSTVVKQPFWIFWVSCALTTLIFCLGWLVYSRIKRGVDRERQRTSRDDFRRRLLRSPTTSARRVGTSWSRTESKHSDNILKWFWRSIFRSPDIDEESGVGYGLGAVRAVGLTEKALKRL